MRICGFVTESAAYDKLTAHCADLDEVSKRLSEVASIRMVANKVIRSLCSENYRYYFAAGYQQREVT
jgi:hypothetical protein